MSLLPSRSLVIHSPLPLERARDRLARHVEPRRLIRFSGPLPPVSRRWPFEGELQGPRFLIRRLPIGGARTPEIQGHIEPAGEGTVIHLAMRVSAFADVVAPMFSLMLVAFAASDTSDVAGILMRLGGAAVLGWAAAWAMLAWEVRKAKRLLRDVFYATSVQSGE